MVINDLVRNVASQLDDNARFEAELMVMSALGINRTDLVINGRREVSDADVETVTKMLEYRKSGEPLQYILGEAEFMSLDFYVESGVLIPRADTEILVEEVLCNLRDGDEIMDICTGSGCIGISLAYYKNITADMVDISDVALGVSRKNAERNGVADRVNVFKMDILNDYLDKKYNVIVSNPPYIETAVIDTLQTEVKDHEPHLALDGGDDGLVFYRGITRIAPKMLKENGILAFEIGYNQGESVKMLMEEDFADVRVIKDLNGNDRVVIGKMKG